MVGFVDGCPAPPEGAPIAVPDADAGPFGFVLALEPGLELALSLGLGEADALGDADVAGADDGGAAVAVVGGALVVGAAVGRLIVPVEPLTVTFTGGGAVVRPTLLAMMRPTATPSAASRSARPMSSPADRLFLAGAADPRGIGVVR